MWLSYTYLWLFSGICGGSASGKTTVARKIIEKLDVPWVTLLSLDSFYKVCSVFCSVAVLFGVDEFKSVVIPHKICL